MTRNQRISTFLDTLFENGLSESQQSVVLSADTSLVGGANTCINSSSITCSGDNDGCTNYGYCGDKNSGCHNYPPNFNAVVDTCAGGTDTACVTNKTKCPTTNIKMVC